MQKGSSSSIRWATGVVLGLAGFLLDLYSSYQLLAQSGTVGEMEMAAYSSSGLAWAVGVGALGAVLAVTSLAYSRHPSEKKMGDFGFLMVVYGLAMLFIGASMYVGITSMASGVFLPAVGMLVLGTLMIANGALMRR